MDPLQNAGLKAYFFMKCLFLMLFLLWNAKLTKVFEILKIRVALLNDLRVLELHKILVFFIPQNQYLWNFVKESKQFSQNSNIVKHPGQAIFLNFLKTNVILAEKYISFIKFYV